MWLEDKRSSHKAGGKTVGIHSGQTTQVGGLSMDCTLGEGVLVPQPALGRKSPSSRQDRKYGIGLLLWLFPLHFSSLKALRSPAVNLFSSFLVFIFELRCQFFRKVFFLTSGKFDPQPTRTCAILLLCSFPPRYLTQLVTVYLFCDLKKINVSFPTR